LAKIAVDFEPSSARRDKAGKEQSAPRSRILARGDGWLVEDVICTAGPQDRPFEEQHSQVAIAIVLSGTFQYRVAGQRRGAGELMTPGSLLLGNAGQHFECGHEHAAGDRCLSFRYASDCFERIAADAGAGESNRSFRVPRVPVVRALSPLIARAGARLASHEPPSDLAGDSWEELSIRLAGQVVTLANGLAPDTSTALPSSVARVTRVVRMIESELSCRMSVRRLAQGAGLSPYHFLRTFEQVTGVTPHQYVRRARLRAAAMRLKTERTRVLDLAMDCGFGDVSNFNRAFHREFGVNPRSFRRDGER
jgi:AraC family transcriptional regulator